MKVRQLIELLQNQPPEMDVFMEASETWFSHVPISEVKIEEIPFKEEGESKTLATENVVVLKFD